MSKTPKINFIRPANLDQARSREEVLKAEVLRIEKQIHDYNQGNTERRDAYWVAAANAALRKKRRERQMIREWVVESYGYNAMNDRNRFPAEAPQPELDPIIESAKDLFARRTENSPEISSRRADEIASDIISEIAEEHDLDEDGEKVEEVRTGVLALAGESFPGDW